MSARSPTRPKLNPEPQFFDIEHRGVRHRVVVKRVANARRFILRVRVSRGDVVLTMPPHGSNKAAQAFALRHAEWVADRVGHLRRPLPFEPEVEIPLRGAMLRLVARPGLRRRAWVEAEAAGSSVLCVSGPAGSFAQTVQGFLRDEARRDLAEAVRRHAAQVGRHVTGLTLRDTKSRWGSCTARGSLNFSWRLIFAPPLVLDYLAAHEVAHLVHMNHSDAFWALTHQLAPRSDEAEQWLKRHGASLHLYGAPGDGNTG
ncbi:M48 family metallopeptidase [Lichenifustis flavocetrariae]|uniref:M48 family metallopeptidase n=1 Tax=Lichenifustis flavocetrariae TaxID=2949735 RepID=A0AA41YQR1_9HYPH|nr:SprT family zinc-dependent metalloprotease [Lichenifustis flavocetrariae]MCW6506809.1 M48 family metallopeptidase [Lichenifustis flavocetrariae]